MAKKLTLTVTELKSLLLARFDAEQSKQIKIQARIQLELGNEVQAEKPEVIAIKKKCAGWISDTIAHRLKQNRRTTPMFSSRDFVLFVPSIVDEIAKVKGDQLDIEERKMLEKFVKTMVKNIFEMVYTTVLPSKNPYEEYWRWVTTVTDLATERGILPTELLAIENATDEITRRMFTKKQFIVLSTRILNKSIDADMLKKIIIQPMLDIIGAGSGKEELREIEKELETKLMPQLCEIVKKSQIVINTWLGEEVERIYATT